ncbi:hypothetical protein [Methylobacterium nigriterrae]|uniref:hypothetical protein n=1 Tax=Methylobacterium nigriterrae TaxID=3127512 RepID=UPI00301389EE
MTNRSLSPARIPGFRLLWCPLALSVAIVALTVAWLVRPRDLDFDSDGFLSSAIGAVGVLLALSALPLPSVAPEE